MEAAPHSPAMQPMTARELMAKLQQSRAANGTPKPAPAAMRKRSFVPDSGFTTFTAGIRVGWQNEIMSRKFRQAVAAEFVAMTLFVAFGSASVVYTELMDASQRVFSISVAFGAMITLMVFAVGDISGANLNPAVTLSLALTRKMSALRAGMYVTAQCLGAMVGSAYVKSLSSAAFDRTGGAANAVSTSPDVNLWTALGGEILGTMLLVFTVSAAADVGRETHRKYVGALTPLCIGGAVFLAHVFLIPIDGCSINPARSFGSAMVTQNWNNHWVFWLGPLVGGPLAALTYDYLFKMPPTTAEVLDDVVGAIERTMSGGSGSAGRDASYDMGPNSDGLPPAFALPSAASSADALSARAAVSTSGVITVKMPKLPPAPPAQASAAAPQILVPGLSSVAGHAAVSVQNGPVAGTISPNPAYRNSIQPNAGIASTSPTPGSNAPLLARGTSTRSSLLVAGGPAAHAGGDAAPGSPLAEAQTMELAARQAGVSEWR